MNESKFCKRCGTNASPSAQYCKNCGAELNPAPAAKESPSPTPPAKEQPVDAKELVNEGISLYQQGDYEGALSKFTKATEVDAKLVAAWSDKGCALGRLGDCVGAVSAFNRALEIDPNNKEAQEGKELCQRMMSSQPQPVKG